jgi:hypothetical protein
VEAGTSVSVETEILVMAFPKAAFKQGEVEQIVAKFKNEGVTVIPVPFANNSPMPPRFDRFIFRK